MAKSKSKSKKKEVDLEEDEEKVETVEKIVEVPTEVDFANGLVEMFLKENSLRLGDEETGRPLDIIFTVPEVHDRFTVWLCNFIYKANFEENGAPEGVTLN